MRCRETKLGKMIAKFYFTGTDLFVYEVFVTHKTSVSLSCRYLNDDYGILSYHGNYGTSNYQTQKNYKEHYRQTTK